MWGGHIMSIICGRFTQSWNQAMPFWQEWWATCDWNWHAGLNILICVSCQQAAHMMLGNKSKPNVDHWARLPEVQRKCNRKVSLSKLAPLGVKNKSPRSQEGVATQNVIQGRVSNPTSRHGPRDNQISKLECKVQHSDSTVCPIRKIMNGEAAKVALTVLGTQNDWTAKNFKRNAKNVHGETICVQATQKSNNSLVPNKKRVIMQPGPTSGNPVTPAPACWRRRRNPRWWKNQLFPLLVASCPARKALPNVLAAKGHSMWRLWTQSIHCPAKWSKNSISIKAAMIPLTSTMVQQLTALEPRMSFLAPCTWNTRATRVFGETRQEANGMILAWVKQESTPTNKKTSPNMLCCAMVLSCGTQDETETFLSLGFLRFLQALPWSQWHYQHGWMTLQWDSWWHCQLHCWQCPKEIRQSRVHSKSSMLEQGYAKDQARNSRWWHRRWCPKPSAIWHNWPLLTSANYLGWIGPFLGAMVNQKSVQMCWTSANSHDFQKVMMETNLAIKVEGVNTCHSMWRLQKCHCPPA